MSEGDSAGPFAIHVAGPVRDCAHGLRERLERIEHVIVESLRAEPHFYLFENDSTDQTRDELLAFCEGRDNVTIHLEDGLDARIPTREQRIAHCRNVLLASIARTRSGHIDTGNLHCIYMPIDLDVHVDWNGQVRALTDALQLLGNAEFDGIFPASAPRYYDIHALRARAWNVSDAWAALARFRRKRRARLFSRWSLRAFFIYSKQFRCATLQSRGRPIHVESAFGGFGLYRWASVEQRTYSVTDSGYCEHIAFNKGLRLSVFPDLTVRAPSEHLEPQEGTGRVGRAAIALLRIWREARWARTTGTA